MTTPTEPSGLLPSEPAENPPPRAGEPRGTWDQGEPYPAPGMGDNGDNGDFAEESPARTVRLEMTSGRDRVLVMGGAILGGLLVVALLLVLFSVRGSLPFGHPAPSPPTATPTPVERLLFQDPLNSTDDHNWPNQDHCVQGTDGYHISANKLCLLSPHYVPPSDANISVDAKQVSGLVDSSYGLAFHHASSGNYYTFEIDGSGRWFAFKVTNNEIAMIPHKTGSSPAIHKGLNATNTLMVRISGSHYAFFVNGQPVGSADDSSFTSGEAGLDGNDSIEVVYTNVKITKTVG